MNTLPTPIAPGPLYPPYTFINMATDEIEEYDVCSPNKNAYDPEVFTYVGTGIIYAVEGYRQRGTAQYHFWRYKQKPSSCEL